MLNYLIIKSLIMSKSYKFTIFKRKNNIICDVVKEIDEYEFVFTEF